MDAVAVHCMKTEETTNMFSEAEFKEMKSLQEMILDSCLKVS